MELLFELFRFCAHRLQILLKHGRIFMQAEFLINQIAQIDKEVAEKDKYADIEKIEFFHDESYPRGKNYTTA